MAGQTTATPPNGAPATPIPGAPGNGQTPTAPRPVPAQESVAQYGGLRGGRAREDGLVPGSAEAIKADRDKDAKRKRDQRVAKKAAEPAPLPSAAPGVPGPAPTPGAPVAGLPGAPLSAPVSVPWLPQDCQGLNDQVVALTEGYMVRSVTEKATEAKLDKDFVKELSNDSQFPPEAREGLKKSGPAVWSHLFNWIGLPSGLKDPIVLAPAITQIVVHHFQVLNRLDAYIADLKKLQQEQAAKPPEKK